MDRRGTNIIAYWPGVAAPPWGSAKLRVSALTDIKPTTEGAFVLEGEEHLLTFNDEYHPVIILDILDDTVLGEEIMRIFGSRSSEMAKLEKRGARQADLLAKKKALARPVAPVSVVPAAQKCPLVTPPIMTLSKRKSSDIVKGVVTTTGIVEHHRTAPQTGAMFDGSEEPARKRRKPSEKRKRDAVAVVGNGPPKKRPRNVAGRRKRPKTLRPLSPVILESSAQSWHDGWSIVRQTVALDVPAITDPSLLGPGAEVEVLRYRKRTREYLRYQARVLDNVGDTVFFVHYRNWSERFNEWKPLPAILRVVNLQDVGAEQFAPSPVFQAKIRSKLPSSYLSVQDPLLKWALPISTITAVAEEPTNELSGPESTRQALEASEKSRTTSGTAETLAEVTGRLQQRTAPISTPLEIMKAFRQQSLKETPPHSTVQMGSPPDSRMWTKEIQERIMKDEIEEAVGLVPLVRFSGKLASKGSWTPSAVTQQKKSHKVGLEVTPWNGAKTVGAPVQRPTVRPLKLLIAVPVISDLKPDSATVPMISGQNEPVKRVSGVPGHEMEIDDDLVGLEELATAPGDPLEPIVVVESKTSPSVLAKVETESPDVRSVEKPLEKPLKREQMPLEGKNQNAGTKSPIVVTELKKGRILDCLTEVDGKFVLTETVMSSPVVVSAKASPAKVTPVASPVPPQPAAARENSPEIPMKPFIPDRRVR